MSSSKGLGRGLDALFPADLQSAGIDSDIRTNQILNVPIDSLVPNPDQPRKSMTDQGLEELAKSIALQGVIQPLLVRRSREKGKYQIIAGERRWRAAQLAHMSEIPVYLKDLSDEDVMLVALIENLQREDLNAAEEASALQELKDKLGITQEELARRLGKSRSMVANSLRLLQLPVEAITALREGRISAGHARCLLPFAQDEQTLLAFLQHILAHNLTVRECEDLLAAWKAGQPLPWQDENAQPAPELPRPKMRTPKSPAFKKLEKELSSLVQCKARISGSNEKGKITFQYKNEEELQKLLAALGMSAQTEEAEDAGEGEASGE